MLDLETIEYWEGRAAKAEARIEAALKIAKSLAVSHPHLGVPLLEALTGGRECPNALLPDGPVCPRCGGKRAPSGVDGGSWVHLTGGRE